MNERGIWEGPGRPFNGGKDGNNYEETIKKRSEAGKRGMQKRWSKNDNEVMKASLLYNVPSWQEIGKGGGWGVRK